MKSETRLAFAAHLESNFHPFFHAAELANQKHTIVEALHIHLPEYPKQDISLSVEKVFSRIQFPIAWTEFLKYFCWWLPPRWLKLANNPGINASTMLLLTNGSIMCQDAGGATWKKLVPDNHGSYVNGTWHDIAPMNTPRLYYASAVLADGRVFFSGGEYTDKGQVETNATEIYNPVTDTWTTIAAPGGWARVGDAACCVLADGRLLMGNNQ